MKKKAVSRERGAWTRSSRCRMASRGTFLQVKSILAFYLALFLTAAPVFAQQQPAGVVTGLQGQAQLTRQATKPLPLRFKDGIIIRDVVDTQEKSLARILFGGRSTVTVRELSRLEVREEILPAGTRRDVYELSNGGILVNVARQLMRPGDEVIIRTPNAVAAVRGTTVFVQYNVSLNQSTVTVLSGFALVQGQLVGANSQAIVSGTDIKIGNVTPGEANQILDQSQIAGKLTLEDSQGQAQIAGKLADALITITGGTPTTANSPSDSPPPPPPPPLSPCETDPSACEPGPRFPISPPGTLAIVGESLTVPGDLFELPSGEEAAQPNSLLIATDATIEIGGRALVVRGTLTTESSEPLFKTDPTTITTGGDFVHIGPAGSLSLTAPLLSDTGGTFNIGGDFLEIDGGTLTASMPSSLFQLNNTTGTTDAAVRLGGAGSLTLNSNLFSLIDNSSFTVQNGPLVSASGDSSFKTTATALGNFGAGTNLLHFSNAPSCGSGICIPLLDSGFNILLQNGADGSKVLLDPTATAFTGLGESNTVTGVSDSQAIVVVNGAGSKFELGPHPLPALVVTSGIAGFSGENNFSVGVISGGELTGSGTVTVASRTNWTGGVMSGDGITNIPAAGTLNISSPSSKTLDTRVLNNAGTASLSGGTLLLNNGALFSNTGTSNALDDADIGFSAAPAGAFSNAGTFRKTGPGTTTTSSVPFNNSGSVDVQSGTLSLAGGGTSTGSFDVDSGATLDFSGGTHNLNAGSSVTGAGKASFSGGTTNVGGTYNLTSPTEISGGTVNFNSAASSTNTLLSAGTLGGTGVFTTTGTFDWTGGSMAGTGSTDIGAGGTLNISGGSDKIIDTRTLNNAGTANLSGGTLFLNNGAIFNNTSGDTFNALDEADISSNSDVAGTFNNAGTFTKSGPGTTTTVSVPFNNTGAVDVQSGSLSLAGGGASTGSFAVDSGTTLNFTGGTHDLNAGSRLTGQGAVNVGPGTLNLNATGINRLAGSLTVTGGSLNVTGSFVDLFGQTLNPLGTMLSLNGGTANLGSWFLKLGGGSNTTVTRLFSLTNSSSFSILNDGLVNVSGGSFFKLTGSSLGEFGSETNFLNFANAPSCSTGTCIPLLNSGFNILLLNGADPANVILDPTVTVFTGLGGSNSITGIDSSEAIIVLDGPTSKFQLGSNPLAPLIITSGTVDFSSGVNPNFLSAAISGGALTGSDTVTVVGPTNWTGGAMLGTGTTLANGGISLGGTTKTLGRTLINPSGQTANWTNGFMVFQDAATFTNLGTFRAAHAGNFSILNGGGEGSKVFDNQGSFIKENPASGTVGNTDINSPVAFNNSGSVDVQAGALRLFGGGTASGSFNVEAGAALNFAGGTHNVNAGSTLTGGGAVNVTSGIVNLNASGMDRLTGTLNVTGGSLNVTGNLVDLSAGETLNPTGKMLNVNGGNFSTTDKLVNLTGASVTAGGTLLDMTNLNLNLGTNPVTQLAGGSTLANTAGPVIKITGGSLTADAIGISNGAGNVFNLTGSVLDLTNTVVTLRTTGGDSGESTDTAIFNLGSNEPFIKMTSSTLALTGEGEDLVSFGDDFGEEPTIQAGVAMISTGTRQNPSTIELAGPLLDLGQVNLTDTNPQIQLTNTTVTETGSNSLIEVFGPATVAGPLFKATDSSISTGGNLLLVEGNLTGLGPAPLIQIDPSTITSGGDLIGVAFGGSMLLASPLISDSGGTFNITGRFLSITDGSGLSSTSTDSLIQLSGSTVTTGTNSISLSSLEAQVPPFMTLEGPLLTATNNTHITASNPDAGGETFLSVVDSANLIGPTSSSAGDAPALISFSNSSLEATGNFLTVRRSLESEAPSTLELGGPLLLATGSNFTVNNMVSVSESGQLIGFGTTPLIQSNPSTFNIGGSFFRFDNDASAAAPNPGIPGPSTINLAGPLLSDSGSTFNIGSRLLGIADGATFGSITANSLIQLNGSTVVTGNSVIAATSSIDQMPPLIMLGGPLLSATNNTQITASNPDLDNEDFLFVADRAQFIGPQKPEGGNAPPLVTFSNSKLTTTGPFLGIRRSLLPGAIPPPDNPTRLVLGGPLLSATGSEFNIDSTFMAISESANLVGLGTSALVQANPSVFNVTGNFLALSNAFNVVNPGEPDPAIVELEGPFLSDTGSTFAIGNRFLFVGGGSTLSSISPNPFVQFNGSTVNTENDFARIDTDAVFNLSGSLLSAGSTVNVGTNPLNSGDLLDITGGGQLIMNTADPVVVFNGGTHMVGTADAAPPPPELAPNTPNRIVRLQGVNTSSTTGLGTDQVIQGNGVSPAPFSGATHPIGTLLKGTGGATIEVKAGSGDTVGGGLFPGNAVRLDTMLLEAALPIIHLIGTGTTDTTATKLTTAGETMDLFRSKVVSLGPVVDLDNGFIHVTNGAFITLRNGSNWDVTGDLLRLANGSKIEVVNGPLIRVTGTSGAGSNPAASTLNVTGALVNFGGSGGNQIIVNNAIAPTANLSGLPVNTATGGSISIGPNPVKNSGLGSITINGTPMGAGPFTGSLIQATNNGTVNISAPAP
ncbi:MAG: FecR domain-containing protein [Deltaproteobacteria bacterium]|nr:FecR domain-containing protein [Deltaproteobacteria bacterium]